MTFHMPIPTRVALGFDEPEGVKKDQDDINSDLDEIDRSFENYLSQTYIATISTGAWVDFVPTVTGTGWVLGNGTLIGQRVYSGDVVHFVAQLTFGSTTVAGGGALGFALPTTPDLTQTPLTVRVLDSSSATRWGGVGEVTSTLAYPLVNAGAGALSFLVAGTPVTYSTGDIIAICGTYRKSGS